MNKEVYVACVKDGVAQIIRVKFTTYLINGGWEETWLDGQLMLRDYYMSLVFEQCHFFNPSQCELVEIKD